MARCQQARCRFSEERGKGAENQRIGVAWWGSRTISGSCGTPRALRSGPTGWPRWSLTSPSALTSWPRSSWGLARSRSREATSPSWSSDRGCAAADCQAPSASPSRSRRASSGIGNDSNGWWRTSLANCCCACTRPTWARMWSATPMPWGRASSRPCRRYGSASRRARPSSRRGCGWSWPTGSTRSRSGACCAGPR